MTVFDTWIFIIYQFGLVLISMYLGYRLRKLNEGDKDEADN